MSLSVVIRVFLFACLVHSSWAHYGHDDTVDERSANRGPLYLSPLIARGQIREAQRQSRVASIRRINIPSYAGFITVNETFGNHLFFWFYPSVRNQNSSALTVWLNGGPTIPSMQGLLWEHGPMDERLRPREVFWALELSVLYIDSPVGVGYSHTDNPAGLRMNTDEIAQDLFQFLEQFYLLFPQYQNRELYIGGQSYAGKFVSSLGHIIHYEKLAGRTNLPLAGVYMGGPLLKAEVMLPYNLDMMYNMGVFSKPVRDAHVNIISTLAQTYPPGCPNADMLLITSRVYPPIPYGFHLDNFASDEGVDMDAIIRVMSRRNVRRRAHIGPNLNFDANNFLLYRNFTSDYFRNYDDELGLLMGNYKVLVYTGDLDITVSNAGVEKVLLDIPWYGQEDYRGASRQVLRGRCRNLQAFFTSVDRFCRVIVHEAGHQTPRDQPRVMLKVMTDFVNHGCLRA